MKQLKPLKTLLFSGKKIFLQICADGDSITKGFISYT